MADTGIKEEETNIIEEVAVEEGATIKEASVAGTFYPANAVDLINQIEMFKNSSKNFYKNTSRAVIVPHAGLIFSGQLAYDAINLLDKGIKNLFIFAPAHKVAFEGLAVSSFDKWETPLGKISLNREIIFELREKFGVKINDDAIAPEHSLEVEVPIIQFIHDDIKIIPILIGANVRPENIRSIIETYYPNTENGFVISSDLSHELADDKATKLDHVTAEMIETGNIQNFQYEMACGAIGIAGLIEFANKSGFNMIRIGMTNSSAVNGDKVKVVGYGSWFLYEGDRNNFIGKYHADFVVALVKTVIKSAFDKSQMTINYPQVFDEIGACFVTLEKDGALRGCIGSILPNQPLINDIVQHAKDAAFKDPRFAPLRADEFGNIKVSVSLMSTPSRIQFKNEEDLLNQIVPYQDGIIIKDGNLQSVYLPSVWNEIPNKQEFLTSLKVKAGMQANYFSPTFEAYRFSTIHIKEA